MITTHKYLTGTYGFPNFDVSLCRVLSRPVLILELSFGTCGALRFFAGYGGVCRRTHTVLRHFLIIHTAMMTGTRVA